MAQSYVGKPAISKGIGRAIRKFVAFAFSAYVLGHQRRACALPRWIKGSGAPRARHAAAFSGSRRGLLENHRLGSSKGPQAGSVLRQKRRTAAGCLGEGGEEAARRRPLWQHATRRQGGARPICLVQD
jgi:hypothetical protein